MAGGLKGLAAFVPPAFRLAQDRTTGLGEPSFSEPRVMEGKVCTKCGQFKALGEYHKNHMAADGLLTHCKECQRASCRFWNKVRLQARRESMRDWHLEHPLASNAHKTANRAVHSGKLVRLACQVCGDPKTVAHHADYARPLDVTWVCRACHKRVHASRRELEAASV